MSLFERFYGGGGSPTPGLPTTPSGTPGVYVNELMLIVDGGPDAVTDLATTRPAFIVDGDTTDVYRLTYYDDDLNPVYSWVGSWTPGGTFADGASGDGVVKIVVTPAGGSQPTQPTQPTQPSQPTQPQPQQPFHYWGVTASGTIDAAGAKALAGKTRKAARGTEFTANGPAGSFVWYVYPASLGDVTGATVAGFSVSPLTTTSLTIDGVAYRATQFGPAEAPIADTVRFS